MFGGETSKKRDIRKFADVYGLPVEMYIVLNSILASCNSRQEDSFEDDAILQRIAWRDGRVGKE